MARFAVLAYAPSQHAKHAVICCRSGWDIRDELGDRFDDLIAECAIYAAASRQPWSEPPITDPPALSEDQRGDIQELRESVATSNRLRAERWLAKRYRDPDFARDYFAVAADDYEDFGHKLIVAVTAWKLAAIFGDAGRYAALRIGVWEMVAYRGSTRPPSGDPIVNMLTNNGEIESAHAVFYYDAARESGVVEDSGPPLSGQPRAAALHFAPYRLARDCGAYLKSFSVAKRLGDARIIAAAKYNLDHAPSLEEFSFA